MPFPVTKSATNRVYPSVSIANDSNYPIVSPVPVSLKVPITEGAVVVVTPLTFKI